MIDRATLQTHRDLLAAKLNAGRLTYADLEVQRDQAMEQLAEVQRQLDTIAGGIQVLDALLAIEIKPANGLDIPLAAS